MKNLLVLGFKNVFKTYNPPILGLGPIFFIITFGFDGFNLYKNF